MKHWMFLFCMQACAANTSDSVTVSGTVPVMVKVTTTQVSSTEFVIHERSNNPDGYQVIIDTDAGSVLFTNTTHQNDVVDVYKTLRLTQPSSYINVRTTLIGE